MNQQTPSLVGTGGSAENPHPATADLCWVQEPAGGTDRIRRTYFLALGPNSIGLAFRLARVTISKDYPEIDEGTRDKTPNYQYTDAVGMLWVVVETLT